MTVTGQTLSGKVLIGGAGSDTLNGLAGGDLLIGEGGNDKIIGGSGNNVMVGGNGNDTIYGGAGNDFVVGGNDTNTYVTAFKGAGQDVISGLGTLIINNSHVISNNIVGFVNGNDLIITYEGDSADSLTIKDFFTSPHQISTPSGDNPSYSYYQANMILNGSSKQITFYQDGNDTYCMRSDGNDSIPGYTTYVSNADPYDTTTPYNNYRNSSPLSFRTAGNTYEYITDDNGVIANMEGYNSKGQLVTDYHFETDGNDSYDGAYKKTTYTYDSAGSLTSYQKYKYNDGTGALTEYNLDLMTSFVSTPATGNDTISVDLPQYQSDLDEMYQKDSNTQVSVVNASTGVTTTTMTLGYSTIPSGDYAGDLEIDGVINGNDTIMTQKYDTRGRLVYNQMANNDRTVDTFTYAYYGNDTLKYTEETYIEKDSLSATVESETDDYTYIGNKAISMQRVWMQDYGNDSGNDTYYYSDVAGVQNTLAGGYTYTGTSGNDLISGSSCADTINGGRGADTMIGGEGNDTYVVDNAGDKVVEDFSNGIDTVIASINYTLGSNVENLTLTGKSNINGQGNSDKNTIIGNDGNNFLNGAGGNDVLVGGKGADILYGSTGNDSLAGGAGNDVYWMFAGDGNDTITDTAGTNTVKFCDTNLSDITDMAAGDDVSIPSTDLALTITTSGNDSIAMEFANANHSILQFKDGLSVDIKNYIPNFATDDSDSTTGNNDVMFITNAGSDSLISGGAGNDLIIYRGSTAATIDGGTGNDIISSGLGNDLLRGGAGNDIYEIGATSGNDSVLDAVGTNTVKLCDMNLSDIRVSCNSDTLVGTTGFSSHWSIQNSQDITINALSKNSTIMQFADGISIDLKTYANNYTTSNTGSSKSDLMYVTNAGGNPINGGAGNDLIIYNPSTSAGATILAGAGNDIISGGLGNDLLNGGAGNDIYAFNAGDGLDTITDSKGTDTIYLGSGVNINKVAVYKDTLDNIDIDYGSSAGSDEIEISAGTKIEKVQLSDGTYLTNKDINTLIQNITTYAGANSISLTNGVTSVKGNSNLMELVNNSWHQTTINALR